MKNLPQISIIVATYNSTKTIRKTLQSVLDQNYQMWECIIIDGKSSDGTVEILEEFAKKDKRYSYVSEKDNGIYDAFNKGWKKAKGEWIYYLGSDDWLTKDGLNELASFTTSSSAIISGDVWVYQLDGRMTLRKAFDGKPNFGYHQGMIMRKDVIERMGGFNKKYKILADYDLMAKIIFNGYDMKVVQTSPIAFFRQGGTTSQIKTLYEIFKEKYEICKSYNTVKYPFLYTSYYLYRKLQSIIYRRLRQFV